MPASPGCTDTKFKISDNNDINIYDYADGTDIYETIMDPTPYSTFKQDPPPVACRPALASPQPAQASAKSDSLASYESAEVESKPGSLDNPLEGHLPSPVDPILMEPKASSGHHFNQLPGVVSQKESSNDTQIYKGNENENREGARGVGWGVGVGGGREEEGRGENGGGGIAGGGVQSGREGWVENFDEEPKMKTGAYEALLRSNSNSEGHYTSLKARPSFD